MKDFTKARELKQFRIDDDVFTCAGALPVGQVREFMAMQRKVDPNDPGSADDYLGLVSRILDGVLVPDSAARFAERMVSPAEPIDVNQLVGVLTWLMEEYGERPTRPVSNSSESLTGANGVTSTDGVLPVTSIPIDSISVAI